ncbi:hypothetical protein IPM62_00875 [Candidatus Woesebacteria bacterium]|nr:MAG: hypothetical protein IPM62_00875 [Candidatus Woesebacteria bacterium]
MIIIPSILTGKLDEFESLMQVARSSKGIHIDFIDGVYADNTTITPTEIDLTKYDNRFFDAHVQVASDSLDNWVEESINAGFDRIITQYESINQFEKYLATIAQAGKIAGIAFDLNTDIPTNTNIYKNIQTVLVMSVKAGFGGQKFDNLALNKISSLAKIRKENNLNFSIGVDGGVNEDNIRNIFQAGADEVVIGRRLLKGDFNANILKYEKALI